MVLAVCNDMLLLPGNRSNVLRLLSLVSRFIKLLRSVVEIVFAPGVRLMVIVSPVARVSPLNSSFAPVVVFVILVTTPGPIRVMVGEAEAVPVLLTAVL